MSEVTEEEQAMMALKLQDSVRELIRKEVLAALQDPHFLNRHDLHHLAARVNGYAVYDPNFRSGIVKMIADRLLRGH